MIDPTQPFPQSRRRWIAITLRWALVSAAVLWLLLLLSAGVLHGFIVPRIGDYREDVENLAAKALGTPVHIGALKAHSDGLIPSIEVIDFKLADSAQPALQIPKIWVALSARSLLRLGVEQLVFEKPTVFGKRFADGSWEIAGQRWGSVSSTDSGAAEWVLHQPEVAVRDATLYWEDDAQSASKHTVLGVQLLLHGGRKHQAFRLTAQTPNVHDVSHSLEIMGRLREPLVAWGKPWEQWNGEIFAQFPLSHMASLPLPPHWVVNSVTAEGMARAWVDMRRGEVQGGTFDFQAPKLAIEWIEEGLDPLQLQHFSGRVDIQKGTDGWKVSGKDWTFSLPNQVVWPTTQWQVSWATHQTSQPWSFTLSYAELGLLGTLAQQVALPEVLRTQLQLLGLSGTLREVEGHWQNSSTLAYQAKGQFQDVHLAYRDKNGDLSAGVEKLQGTFVLTETSGSAELQMLEGAVSFPQVFEEPRIPVHNLKARVEWLADPVQGMTVEVKDASFANSDAQGRLQAQWTERKEAVGLPGELVLDGVLERANGARVYRYLPLAVPKQAREYVRDSVRQGYAQNVQFKVQGALKDFPFADKGSGSFYIKAPVQDVVFDYVPPALREQGHAPWPVMSHLAGDLVFQNEGMSVHKAHAKFGREQRVEMADIEASIPDLAHPVVAVSGKSAGSLHDMMELVRSSAISNLTEQAMDHMQVDGTTHLQLKMVLPIDEIENSKVQGTVALTGNRIRFRDDVPELQNAKGEVHFSEAGFDFKHITAEALGGKVQLHGGLQVTPISTRLDIQGNGNASVDGVIQDGFLSALHSLSPYAKGSADYTLQVGLQNHLPKVEVWSNLQGVALDLPAPMGKHSEQVMPLSIEYGGLKAERGSELVLPHLQVRLGSRSLFSYLWDADVPDKVRSGWWQVGGDVPDAARTADTLLALNNVHAQFTADELDVNQWMAAWNHSVDDHIVHPSSSSNWESYLPHSLSLSLKRVSFNGRELNDLRVEAKRRSGMWSGRVHAQEIAGEIDYENASLKHSEGKLRAKLERLYLHDVQSSKSAMLSSGMELNRPMPALDIDVKDVMLGDRRLGRWTVHARNQLTPTGSQWLLEQFDIVLPEAVMRAQGRWESSPQAARSTSLQFAIELKDSGKLLERFAMPGVIRGGTGHLLGEAHWNGSPIAPDWQGMSGNLQLDVGEGQFLKVEPGMAKLLSVLSLQSLPRRIGLDFRDVFSSGFAFDFVRGDVRIEQGIARTNNLQMKGVNAAVLMEGQASLPQETQKLRVVVVPEINAMTASLVATAINPVIGLGSFLAQALLRGPLVAAGTREFEVTGDWSDPQVRAVPYKSQGDGAQHFTPSLH